MINIESQLDLPVDPALLESAARQSLAYAHAAADLELTLVIGSDSLLQQYNQQYLGIDAPTDVLSFPAEYTDPYTQAQYLGDILISLPRAQQQAAQGGHTLVEELQLLVVHGVLHLLGHDHAEAVETARMQTAQDAIMSLLGSRNSPRLSADPDQDAA
jgi:probable rRNA maturation factor